MLHEVKTVYLNSNGVSFTLTSKRFFISRNESFRVRPTDSRHEMKSYSQYEVSVASVEAEGEALK